ncbi:unnamed protein product [Nezara viridula]|uniref:Chitin-binding type-2 domain-containing protein n=1 Tax=Nezara viridula TaxID=85310 RepID=A0A9P0MVW4_NEZVI|nr:unnamed protein product [Nezara viridula]
MILLYAVFLMCFVIIKTDRRQPFTLWRAADLQASSTDPKKSHPNPNQNIRRKPRSVTRCISPQTNFFESKKIRNGTLLFNCKPPTPYCNFERNLCVSSILTKFKCDDVSDGHYPHIADCRGSMICRGGNNIDQPCSDDTSYDYKTKKCIGGKRICVIPNCVNKSETYVRHPAERNLFVLCIAGIPSSLYICPPGYLFSPNKTQPCEFICFQAGLFPDVYDETKYNRCSRTAYGLIRTSVFLGSNNTDY